MNRIHWKTTARHGEIQVKEFDLEQTADAWIVLDLQRGDPGRPRRRVDDRGGVRAAASIADKALEREPRGRHDRQRRPARRSCRPTAAAASTSRSCSSSPRSRPTAARRSSRRSSRASGRLRRGHDRGRHHAVARSGVGPAARGAPDARRRLRRRDARRAGLRPHRTARPRPRPTGESRAPDAEREELAAKRTRALRHALAEYELRSYVVTPGRPLGEILVRMTGARRWRRLRRPGRRLAHPCRLVLLICLTLAWSIDDAALGPRPRRLHGLPGPDGRLAGSPSGSSARRSAGDAG